MKDPVPHIEQPRPASTVILVRQIGEALQIYLLRRSAESGFFPGMYVFPGGAVSSQDRDARLLECLDVPATELRKRFGNTPAEEEALAHAVSAVRETFEEAGVFLGRAAPSAAEWLKGARARRISQGLEKTWLKEAATGGLCSLGISMLNPWAHWITPMGMPKRYDTRFFVAFMPHDQDCSPDGKETTDGLWLRAEDALAGNLKGQTPLSPPTLITLHQLLPYRKVEDLQAALTGRSWGAPIFPKLFNLRQGAMLLEPWDPMYARELQIDADSLENAILPVGTPFSRVWLHKGAWKPVGHPGKSGKGDMQKNPTIRRREPDLEKELRQSEQKYRSIFENSVEGIFQSTPEGRFLSVNPALAHIHRYDSPEEMIAHIKDIGTQLWVGKEERRRYTQLLQSQEVVKDFEGEMYRKDGTRVWVSLSTRTMRDVDGRLLYYLGTAEDITYKRQAEEALRESEERYRVLFENSADGILLTTPEGEILAANEAACRMFGRGEEELRRVNRAGIMDVRDPVVQAALQRRKVTGVLRTEHYHIRKDGSRFLAEVSSNMFTDKDGKTRASTIIRDVTEIRKAEEEKKELEDQLRQARKMEAIGTLAGGIAHEFNNILGIVLGNAELAMIDTPDDSRAQSRLREIEKASFRARDMIKQLLSFSRKGEVNRKPTRAGELFRDSLKFLRGSIPSSIEIRQDIDPDPWSILGDLTQLNQVLINLCSNASDAMKDGGILTLGLRNVEMQTSTGNLAAGKYVELAVTDTGTGIPAEFLDRIYDPYFTTKETGKGTGLGLAVVHGIVQDHEGLITVESEPGKGTTFHVFLPAIEVVPGKEASLEGTAPRGSESVLFIDDEPSIVDMAKSMLERLGYFVEATTDPIEALRLFGADPQKFHLVITDTTMPRMMGDQVARELLALRPDIRVILCTGYSERVNEERAREIGASACLTKPIHFQELASRVRQVLDEPAVPRRKP